MKKVDLHTHTYFSDGLLSPKQLISLANNKKISAISITDHDTIDGLLEGKKEAIKKNIEFINGVEFFSIETEILGYLFDEKNSALINFLEKQILQKEKYAIKKIEQLNNLNIDIEIEEVYEKIKPGRVVTTTHIAQILLEKGYVKEIQEAFKKYINKEKVILKDPPENAKKIIKLIKNAGGVSVLPHPWYLKDFQKENLEYFLIKLEKYGLNGIETTGYIPNENILFEGKNLIKRIKEISRELKLVETGGSDFHSEKIHPHNILGKYNISYTKLNELKKKIK
ncbi:MAG: PHP domain-containing protein [Candidatus ainarchaeum sp.]|nr:PHP domain-containing protein [Candidatus ainarchaeum sp.]